MKTLIISLFTLLLTLAKVHANTIVILGDSLSSAYGFDYDKGWVSLLIKRSQNKHYCTNIKNLSTSGDTTSNGLTKLKHYLEEQSANTVVIQLGGNDALRGINLNKTKENLQKMINLCKQKNIKVLLLATRLPPNYGPIFLNKFKKLYQTLAKENNLSLEETMLKGVAEKASLMQADGLHPTQKAQTTILNNLWPYFQPLLEKC